MDTLAGRLPSAAVLRFAQSGHSPFAEEFDAFNRAYERANREESRRIADRWVRGALKVIEPLRGSMMPEMVFKMVLLPAPLLPSTVAIWPCSTCRLTPRIALMGP